MMGRRRFLVHSLESGLVIAVGLALPPERDGPALVADVDADSAIQRTIDQAHRIGGGTVELSAGQTYTDGGVEVPETVTLSVKGTLIRAADSDRPLVTLSGLGAAIDGHRQGVIDGSRASASTRSNIVEVQAPRCSVLSVTIKNGTTNGIAIFNQADNRVDGCTLTEFGDNGIIVGDRGADRNVISHNTVRGTKEQNGIFVTASPGSTATDARVHDNKVIGNVTTSIGDTGIESGIGTVNTEITDNRVEAAYNPGILLRDCRGVRVSRCTVTTSARTRDAYAVTPQIQAAQVPVDSSFTDCTVIGNASRAGFYLGSEGVTVIRARLVAGPGSATPRGTAFLEAGIDHATISDPYVEDGWSSDGLD